MGFPSFDLKKVLFLPNFPSQLGQEVEIRYVHLVGALDVLFEGLDFSAPKKWFIGQVFAFLSFLEFVPRMAPFQIELGI